MRKGTNEVFVTAFWQQAYDRLPAGVRGQYLARSGSRLTTGFPPACAGNISRS
jgi:hypothetical protein